MLLKTSEELEVSFIINIKDDNAILNATVDDACV